MAGLKIKVGLTKSKIIFICEPYCLDSRHQSRRVWSQAGLVTYENTLQDKFLKDKEPSSQVKSFSYSFNHCPHPSGVTLN